MLSRNFHEVERALIELSASGNFGRASAKIRLSLYLLSGRDTEAREVCEAMRKVQQTAPQRERIDNLIQIIGAKPRERAALLELNFSKIHLDSLALWAAPIALAGGQSVPAERDARCARGKVPESKEAAILILSALSGAFDFTTPKSLDSVMEVKSNWNVKKIVKQAEVTFKSRTPQNYSYAEYARAEFERRLAHNLRDAVALSVHSMGSVESVLKLRDHFGC